MIGGVVSGQSRVEVLVELEEEGAGVLVRPSHHDQERDELDVGQLGAGRGTRDEVGADHEKHEDHVYFLVELLERLAPVGFATDGVAKS